MEFAGFRALEDGIGARSWFCDPSAPWQKGAVVSQRDLTQLARERNDQPRRCLGYRTPAEVFMAHLQEAG